ncbi:MAG: PrsW family intramembrane metalloprotease [Myxococcales bacterium]|nr:PrsW family intramembrane metalloprotease [Myxococcales bacterium]
MLVGMLLGLVFVTPIVLVYVLFVRWCDRFEPEPWWLVTCAFVWGAVIATLFGGMASGYVEHVIAQITGLATGHPGIQAFGATVLAPVFEEGFKGIGVALIALVSALGLKELDGPLDGAIYGGIVGLGFTMTEDILYVATQYRNEGLAGFFSLLVIRTVLLGLSHCTFTACTGLGFGIAAESRKLGVKIFAPVIGFVFAMGMHAMHNGLPTFFGENGAAVMIVITWCIAALYFVLLGVLVARDRAIVIRELWGEVGGLLHAKELKLVSSYFALGRRNMQVLREKGWAAWSDRRSKQLALVELAFLKNRRRRGEKGKSIDEREARLRQEIAHANRRGVWIGG